MSSRSKRRRIERAEREAAADTIRRLSRESFEAQLQHALDTTRVSINGVDMYLRDAPYEVLTGPDGKPNVVVKANPGQRVTTAVALPTGDVLRVQLPELPRKR